MNSDTYNNKIDENLKTTFILQNYDKKIVLGFDIPLQLAAIIHMLGYQMYLIMDLPKKIEDNKSICNKLVKYLFIIQIIFCKSNYTKSNSQE
jgi:hypothetical protein